MNALLGGQVQLMFPTIGSVALHMKSGKVRALAVDGPRAFDTRAHVADDRSVGPAGLTRQKATHGPFCAGENARCHCEPNQPRNRGKR
jgi:hypothetical protein